MVSFTEETRGAGRRTGGRVRETIHENHSQTARFQEGDIHRAWLASGRAGELYAV